MSFTPRLVALDVDGTLVDENNVLSPSVRGAVRAMRDRGMHVVISTGRAVPGVLNVTEKLGFASGHAVGSNGALVFDYGPFELLHSVTFDASEAVRRVLEQMPDVLVAVEEVGHGYRVSAPFPEGEMTGTLTVQSVEELVAEPVTRVIIRAPEKSADDFHRLVAGLGLSDINYFIGYTAWLDLAPDGVSKASGLEWLCQRLGVDRSEVLAVGDGHNDVEMLLWAGRGVAMGQSPEALKVVADAVTGSVHEDGLATELIRYL